MTARSSPRKRFIRPEHYLADCFRLAATVLKSGYRPDIIVGVWRGGAPPAIICEEFLGHYGVKARSVVVRAKGYRGMKRSGETKLGWLGPLRAALRKPRRVLVVDDVCDTGLTLMEVVNLIRNLSPGGATKTATLYYKPTLSRTGLVPDFFVHRTAVWLVFPHELDSLTKVEAGRKILRETARPPHYLNHPSLKKM